VGKIRIRRYIRIRLNLYCVFRQPHAELGGPHNGHIAAVGVFALSGRHLNLGALGNFFLDVVSVAGEEQAGPAPLRVIVGRLFSVFMVSLIVLGVVKEFIRPQFYLRVARP